MALIKAKLQEIENKKEETKTSKDSMGRTYGTGRRKSSIARVWVKSGKGAFVVNNKTLEEYFRVETLCSKILSPFKATNSEGKFDVFCTVKGGGHSGQAGAVLLGIARALDKFDSEFHANLRSNGMLTRDSRVVERKKYGKRKARRSTQFSKR
jgi:small subunit ribosomal protein S9